MQHQPTSTGDDMIYDPYSSMEPPQETHKDVQSVKKRTAAKLPELQTCDTGYPERVDDADGPLAPDAVHPASVQGEAEGHVAAHSRHGSITPSSPILRIKFEEELFRETIPALWGSEQDQEVALHRRHSRERSESSHLCRCTSDADDTKQSDPLNTKKDGKLDTRPRHKTEGCSVCMPESTIEPPLKRSYRPSHDCGRNPEHTRPYEGSANDTGSPVKVNRGAW